MGMVFCRGCGNQLEQTAAFCGRCGAAQGAATGSATGAAQAKPASQAPDQKVRQPASPPSSGAAISKSWQRKFALIEKAGGPDTPLSKQLDLFDRMRVNFNVWALLLGPIYYVAKGMWRRAITLLIVCVVIGVIAVIILEALHKNTNVVDILAPIIFAVRANTDYYKKIVLKNNGWW